MFELNENKFTFQLCFYLFEHLCNDVYVSDCFSANIKSFMQITLW